MSLQAVDITCLSDERIDQLEKNPTSMSIDANGIAHPQVKKISYKSNAYSDNLVKNWPKATKVMPNGKVKLLPDKLPWEEQLKRMARRKGPSRENWMAQCKPKSCLKILENLPGSSYQNATKKELTRQLNKFCGVKPQKSHKQKLKDKARKEEKKSKKRSSKEVDEKDCEK